MHLLVAEKDKCYNTPEQLQDFIRIFNNSQLISSLKDMGKYPKNHGKDSLAKARNILAKLKKDFMIIEYKKEDVLSSNE